MLKSLNHITITVSDLEKSLHFYIEILGMKLHAKWTNGAYLSVGGLWFCLSLGRPSPGTDYSHIAFSVETSDFSAAQKSLMAINIEMWKENSSEGDSIYFLDPDGYKLEIHVGTLQSRLDSLKNLPYSGLEIF
ncbi:fosfomycin resistance glutathione transferase [Microbulbifer sp. OS29]|uniref:Fosfomycin resistance glutathione transferase n=1 Tax=Microbulbifer okhotskensis TaxID=2926617 RepID=A0A9X2J624_9GAMM|nr:fosfomycin resistance glutathione transferase [Microbulbifer okhotskensis]MCO1334994.1 fosfomycin resistance glutathione transferase [Microbulbifer okhotskensis]